MTIWLRREQQQIQQQVYKLVLDIFVSITPALLTSGQPCLAGTQQPVNGRHWFSTLDTNHASPRRERIPFLLTNNKMLPKKIENSNPEEKLWQDQQSLFELFLIECEWDSNASFKCSFKSLAENIGAEDQKKRHQIDVRTKVWKGREIGVLLARGSRGETAVGTAKRTTWM